MVTTRSACSSISMVRALGLAALMSMPASRMTSMALESTASAGFVPAEIARALPLAK